MLILLLAVSILLCIIKTKFFFRHDFDMGYILLLVLMIIMGGTTSCADYDEYASQYYASKYFSFEYIFDLDSSATYGYSRNIIYAFLNYISLCCGFDYQMFKIISSIIFLILLYFVFKKMTGRMACIVLVMYSIYPFAIDIIQVRNFMKDVMLILSFYYFFFYKNSKLAIMFFIIAVGIQDSAILYSPFFLINKLYEKNIFKYLFGGILIFCISMPIYAEYIQSKWLLVGLMMQDSETIASHYAMYAYKSGSMGFIYSYLVVLTIFLLMSVIERKQRIYNYLSDAYVIIFVKRLTLYTFLFFPVFPLVSSLAVRSSRFLLVFFYAVVALLVGSKVNVYFKTSILISAIVLSLIVGYVGLFNPLLNHNVETILRYNFFGLN